jgi:hypothetical protein
MDAGAIDRIARSIATVTDRRLLARGLFGLLGAGIAATTPMEATEAAKHKHKHKKKKRNKNKDKDRCDPDCTGKVCGPDGCGGNCGACAQTEVCLAGECARFCDVCASGCLFNSINAAIASVAPGGTVILCPETFTGTVIASQDVTIVGGGADSSETVLDGGGTGAVLIVQPGKTVTVRNLTITGVDSGTFGGVSNDGTLSLEAVHVVENTASNFGGMFNGAGATLTLIDSLVQGNTSTSLGGGIRNATGTVTLIRTTVEGNQAKLGGGISTTVGTVHVTDDSHVTGNTAAGDAGVFGGGVFNEGHVTVESGSSIEDNTPDDCVDANGGTGCP